MYQRVQNRESLLHRRLGDLGVERRVLLLQLLQTSMLNPRKRTGRRLGCVIHDVSFLRLSSERKIQAITHAVSSGAPAKTPVLARRELGGHGSTIQYDQAHRPPLRVAQRMPECSRQCARADRIVTRLIELGAQ